VGISEKRNLIKRVIRNGEVLRSGGLARQKPSEGLAGLTEPQGTESRSLKGGFEGIV